MSENAINLKYVKQDADCIGSDHKGIYMTPDEVIATLDELIHMLGTFDITVIRASMGMYLICKAIHEQTDIRVLLTGEISDELLGYKYTDFTSSAEAFQQGTEKCIVSFICTMASCRPLYLGKYSGNKSAVRRSCFRQVCYGS